MKKIVAENCSSDYLFSSLVGLERLKKLKMYLLEGDCIYSEMN